MRLLLLEDEPAIRTALARAMRRWGHRVEVAESVADARQVAAAQRPEGLISDLKLPDGSGLEVARDLAVPFVLMSGYAVFDDAVAALRIGCVDFLTKPVALETLRPAVEALANRSGESAWSVVAEGPDGLQRHALETAAPVSETLFTQALSWNGRDQGDRPCEDLDAGATADVRERQLVAELVQASPQAGELVINHGRRWWRAWLRASVDWAAGQEQGDRRRLIDDLADRAVFHPDLVAVEVLRDG